MKYLMRRGNRFYYFRRVPVELSRFDPRPHIQISLKVTDRAQAEDAVKIQNKAVEDYWRALVTTNKVHGADTGWRDAVALARVYNFTYKTMAELAETEPLEGLLDRLVVAKKVGLKPRMANALLGGAGKPVLRLSAACDLWFELRQDRLAGKPPDFIIKWKSPRIRAVNNLIAAATDKDITALDRRDILDLKKWWMDKIAAEKLDPGTANKDFMHLKDMVRAVATEREIEFDIATLFADIKFQGFKRSRDPFDADFVRDKILASGKLDGLNEEARWIVQIMAETGAGPNEVIGLDPEKDIVLDGKIPYIHIRPNQNRELKTPDARNSTRPRQIPLVGIALVAARQIPVTGFMRYENADSASAAINKFMTDNGMKQTEKTTLYSLRHTFKDRLRDAGAPEEVIDNLMGHAGNRPKYGRGHALETKKLWLDKIAFEIKLPK